MNRFFQDKRYLPVLVSLLLVMVVAGAFMLGRRSISADSTDQKAASAPSSGAGHTEGEAGHAEGEAGHAEGESGHAEGEEHGEEGVVKFDETSLKLANLQVEPIQYRSLQSRLPVTGTVEPNLGGVVKVTPRVGGKVTSVAVNVGDNVRAGQRLATLASTELATAQAQYRQGQARVDMALANLERQKRLAGLGEFGRHKVEEARGAAAEAQGMVNTTENEIAAARTEVVEARSDKAALEGEVASAQAEVSAAQSEIREAEGQVRALRAAAEQAETQVKVTQSKFNRYDTLLKEQLASRQDWEQAQADFQKARSDVDAARANISQGEAKVETARGHLQAAQAKVRAAQGRVQQATAKIETAQARQKEVESRLATARKRLEIAQEALAREERVLRGGFLASKEVQEAEAALRQARLEARAAADAVRLLGGEPGSGNTVAVAAPLAGRVTERLVTLGETVTLDKALFTVINLQSVWVQLAVQQKDLPVVRVGQSVAITSDTAPGRTFNGTVSYIGDVVDETTRTVKVRAVIQNPGGLLKPQTFVRGRIAADVRASALAVPRDAVQSLEGKTVVFVAGDHPGEFTAKEVQTGDTVAGLTQVTSGLEPGARVVTKGAFTVKAQAQKAELGHDH